MGSSSLELCFAVVKLAVDDLSSTDEQVRFEAHEFFLQPRGGWADMRRFYFDALNLNEERVIEALADRFDPPEKPEATRSEWTFMEIYEICPDGEFKAMLLAPQTGLRYSLLGSRLSHLKKIDLIRSVGRGIFARTDWLKAQAICAPELPEGEATTVLEALASGPKTIRDIGFAMGGEMGAEGIRNRLEKAQAAGIVVRDGPTWALAA